jgi:hypothetical protein
MKICESKDQQRQRQMNVSCTLEMKSPNSVTSINITITHALYCKIHFPCYLSPFLFVLLICDLVPCLPLNRRFGLGRVKADSTLRVAQIQQLSTLNPVGLGRSHSAWPSRLQRFVDLPDFAWNLSALFKVETLHVRHCLVDPANRRRVANSPFCTIPWPQVRAMDTPDTHLALHQLLSAF